MCSSLSPAASQCPIRSVSLPSFAQITMGERAEDGFLWDCKVPLFVWGTPLKNTKWMFFSVVTWNNEIVSLWWRGVLCALWRFEQARKRVNKPCRLPLPVCKGCTCTAAHHAAGMRCASPAAAWALSQFPCNVLTSELLPCPGAAARLCGQCQFPNFSGRN